jgi:hypothetical protein
MFLAMFMRIALCFESIYWFKWKNLGLLSIFVKELRTKYYFIWVVCSLFTAAPAKSEKVDGHKGRKELAKRQQIISKCTFTNHYDWSGFLIWQYSYRCGMTNGVPGALYIMITAVVISVLIMMQFAVPGSSLTKILRYKF